MKKQEFLNELRKQLAGLPKDDLDNRINFYEEMINDRMDEGLSEEEAVADIGTVDDIVKQIASETPMLRLVAEKAKPKRTLRAWEIVLIVLGFPLWLPLLIVGLVLLFVGCLLFWILVIVTYVVEVALVGSSVLGFVTFMAYLLDGGVVNFIPLGYAIIALGLAFVFVFACIGATKLTIFLHKKMFIGIKSAFIRKGAK